MNFIEIIKNIDWNKNIQNFILFAGADTIVALAALQTQLIPMIHNPAGTVVAVILVNWIIDLIKKFLEAHQKLA